LNSLLQHAGPGITTGNPYKLIYHPLTGLCVTRKTLLDPLTLGPCHLSEGWKYTPQKTLSIKGTYFCIHAEHEGMTAKLGIICSDSNSKWEMISDSKLHLSSKLSDGSDVCLDVDDNNKIVTNACKCLSRDRTCDPSSQWFKLIDSGRRSIFTSSSSLMLNSSDLLWKPLSSI